MDLHKVDRLPGVPDRPVDAHKGTFGTVIVVGGCATMIGAPALCAMAAFRAGAGLVKIAAPREWLAPMLTIWPGATGIEPPSDAHQAVEAINKVDGDGSAVLAIGPGLGRDAQTPMLVEQLLRGRRDVVLDADGLNALAARGRPRPRVGDGALVMTPHPGEFRRLARALAIEHDPTDPAQRPAAAAALARACGAVVLLKGHHTIVSDGQRVYENQSGNPALATAGSGDVLTGLIAALLAQQVDAFDAAMLGAHLHGLAADAWAHDHGPSGMRAVDLANLLPDAFAAHRAQRSP